MQNKWQTDFYSKEMLKSSEKTRLEVGLMISVPIQDVVLFETILE